MAARAKFIYILQQGRAVVSERMSKPKETSLRFVVISDTVRAVAFMDELNNLVLVRTTALI